jgi:hypothetical protein
MGRRNRSEPEMGQQLFSGSFGAAFGASGDPRKLVGLRSPREVC